MKPDFLGLTDYDRQSGSSREAPAAGQRGQREEALPKAGIPLRAGFRDAGSILRKDRRHHWPMSGSAKEFLRLEDTASAALSSCSAERSALVADALRCGGFLRLRVRGESMLPVLWPGDVVEIASCSLEEVRPGEIVLALRDGRLFLHRLVRPTSNGFLLRGDSMPSTDPQFSPEALLGRLVCSGGEQRWISAPAVSRAVGRLLCYCGIARRLALKLHNRRAFAHEFRRAGAD